MENKWNAVLMFTLHSFLPTYVCARNLNSRAVQRPCHRCVWHAQKIRIFLHISSLFLAHDCPVLDVEDAFDGRNIYGYRGSIVIHTHQIFNPALPVHVVSEDSPARRLCSRCLCTSCSIRSCFFVLQGSLLKTELVLAIVRFWCFLAPSTQIGRRPKSILTSETTFMLTSCH